jgi:hypothetical protein
LAPHIELAIHFAGSMWSPLKASYRTYACAGIPVRQTMSAPQSAIRRFMVTSM